MQTSAKDVLETVYKDLKDKGYTQEKAARELGYATRQAVSAILSADKYMTRAQARRFGAAFGYYEPYLVSGEGTLAGPAPDQGTAFYVPQHALLLRPFDSLEDFDRAFDSFMQSMVAAYGANDIQRFLGSVIQYLNVMQDPIKSFNRTLLRYGDRPLSTNAEKTDPDRYDKAIEDVRNAVLKIQTRIQMEGKPLPAKEMIRLLQALDKDQERRREKKDVEFKLESPRLEK